MQKMTRRLKFIIPVFLAAVFLVGSGFKSDFFEIAKQIEIFTTLFKELNMNYVDETNPAELMDTAIKNMLEDLDPYTRYLNEQDVEAFRISNTGEYSGIGALIRAYDDRMVVVEPYEGYPADKAGLKAGDEIIKIGDIAIADFKDDAAELLKGASNSSVEITYMRQGKIATTSVERGAIEVDAVPFYGMVDEKTGYVVLARFNRKASSQTKAAINQLKDQGAEQFILDLRGNPGGLLSEAINVTNLFVPKGELIVTTKSKVKKFNNQYKTTQKPLDENVPLVVLIDGQSASASEIVSGSLQDLDRAVVMGARSFGKGLVQRPLKLTYGTQLKVTISRYYTPSGRCIQALDYWNRDEAGNAVRNKEFKEFTTRNGRKVFDGGGVMPDVEIASIKGNELTQALLQNHVIFDFATEHYYANPLSDPKEFSFGDSQYNRFKSFVSSSDFSYETQTEKALKAAFSKKEEVIFDAEIEKDFQELMGQINTRKIAALDTYRDEIQTKIEDELITRYFYRNGLYTYYLKHDKAIETATELLSDAKAYKETLQ